MLQVLSHTSGEALPGELVGLLGPSGAGKSTLLDLISGRKTTGHVTGSVTCNGLAIGPSLKRLSAYIPQEDVFVPVSVPHSCTARSAVYLLHSECIALALHGCSS